MQMTTHTCNYGQMGCAIHSLITVGWLLLASGLLWATWNRVFKTVFGAKSVKYWQVLLALVTVVVLALPAMHMHMRMKHDCGSKQPCPHAEKAQLEK